MNKHKVITEFDNIPIGSAVAFWLFDSMIITGTVIETTIVVTDVSKHVGYWVTSKTANNQQPMLIIASDVVRYE